MRRMALLGLTFLSAALVVVSPSGPYRLAAAQGMPAGSGMAQGTGTTEISDLRSKLDNLMSGHTVLAGITTQKADTSAPDFEAALHHLDMNSVQLSEFIGSLYGQDAAASFLPLWRSHIQMYIDYTRAAGNQDAAGKDQARTALGQWIQTQANQLAALNPALPADTVAAELTTHVNGTLAAIDTFGAGEYDQHYELMHRGFDHSFMMGGMMASAIAQQFPDRFAQRSPTTSAGR
jgi:hypothetical protein